MEKQNKFRVTQRGHGANLSSRPSCGIVQNEKQVLDTPMQLERGPTQHQTRFRTGERVCFDAGNLKGGLPFLLRQGG